MANLPTFKFKTNIAEKILFQYSEPKTGTGQYGAWYLWGVQVNGQDMGMFASQGLQDRLTQIGDLKGRMLEITKVETDENRTVWVIKDENGVEIPFSSKNAPQGQIKRQDTPGGTLDTIMAKEMRITKLAVLKSAIEGGQVQRVDEGEEEFLERWIKWVYKNTEHDKKLTLTEIPF